MTALWLVFWLVCGCGGAVMATQAAQDRNGYEFFLGLFAMAFGIACGWVGLGQL